MRFSVSMFKRPLYILYRVGEMLVSLFSRFVNAAFLCGSTHQTTSARAHVEDWEKMRKLINAVFFLQEDHCKKAWEDEVAEAKRTLEKANIKCE